MPLREVTARDFQSRPGEYQEEARQAPIVITNHGRKAFVLMSWQLFEERYLALDTRRSLTVDELPPELQQKMLDNMSNYESGDPLLDELYERGKTEKKAGRASARR
jgi:prevent-host-death family protein